MTRRFLIALGVAFVLALMLAGMVWASEPAQAGKPGRPIVVRWSTESEVNTAGFNVYRSDSEDGPWTKINSQLIPAHLTLCVVAVTSLQTRTSLLIKPIGTSWRRWSLEVRPTAWSVLRQPQLDNR